MFHNIFITFSWGGIFSDIFFEVRLKVTQQEAIKCDFLKDCI